MNRNQSDEGGIVHGEVLTGRGSNDVEPEFMKGKYALVNCTTIASQASQIRKPFSRANGGWCLAPRLNFCMPFFNQSIRGQVCSGPPENAAPAGPIGKSIHGHSHRPCKLK